MSNSWFVQLAIACGGAMAANRITAIPAIDGELTYGETAMPKRTKKRPGRGDQTLDQFHQAIFQAYNRCDEHLYEFQFGRRPRANQ